MKKLTVCFVILIIFISLSINTLKVRSIEYDITIETDGSITPSDSPMFSNDNITYVLTGNTSGINVRRNNTIVDGAGYTVQTTVDPYLYLSKGILTDQTIDPQIDQTVTNITIMNINVKGFCFGVYFKDCTNITVTGSNMTNNEYGIKTDNSNHTTINNNNLTHNNVLGIWLAGSNNAKIFNNHFNDNTGSIQINNCQNITIEANRVKDDYFPIEIFHSHDDRVIKNGIVGDATNRGPFGVWLGFSSNISLTDNNVSECYYAMMLSSACTDNIIARNNIQNNDVGFYLENATSNHLYHNNLLNNDETVIIEDSKPNFLDNGVEGNYWSNYNGTDVDQDGIGDSPYIIDTNNTDHYPLMKPYVALFGDVNQDRKVNLKDVMTTIQAFNSFLGQLRWNPDADVDNSGRVDMRDVVLIILNFNRHE